MEFGILKGLRVLDFTRVLAGPYATRLFADFGAEVIKVQSKETATGAEFDKGGYFNTWNRNKKSMTLNLNFPEAKEIVIETTLVYLCNNQEYQYSSCNYYANRVDWNELRIVNLF